FGLSSVNMNSNKNIFYLKAVVITGCFFMFGCSNNYQEVQDLAKKKMPVDKATQVESYLSQDGIVKAKLTSPLMIQNTLSDTPTIEFPHSLHVDFYDSTQKVQSKLFAKYGLDYKNQHKILLRDSVIIFNITGDTLRCEKLWWDQDKELIYTDVPVHIRKPDESIDGTGLTADQNFSYWTIKNAKGPISVADSTLPSN
ncbi:MAG TPA: LPS export ABC transporter periplasmic protein LptC, partial [Parafilimonas sp.]